MAGIHIYGSMLVILSATASYNSTIQYAEKEEKIDSLRNKNSIIFLLEAYYTQIWH